MVNKVKNIVGTSEINSEHETQLSLTNLETERLICAICSGMADCLKTRPFPYLIPYLVVFTSKGVGISIGYPINWEVLGSRGTAASVIP